jgi:hypothetical protein
VPVRELLLAVRRSRLQPGFALAAICTLALGMAAPTALYAVVKATLLEPLPYPHPGDIYYVRTTMTDGRFTIGGVASRSIRASRRPDDWRSMSSSRIGRTASIRNGSTPGGRWRKTSCAASA